MRREVHLDVVGWGQAVRCVEKLVDLGLGQ